MLSRRDSYHLIASYITPKQQSREFAILAEQIGLYYQRDATANSVNRELFLALLAETFVNKKHLTSFTTIIDEAYASEVSVVNIDELVLRSKQTELGQRIAVALANKEDGVLDMMDEYKHIAGMSSLEEMNGQGVEVYEQQDAWDSIMDAELARQGSLRIYPRIFNDKLNSRLNGGHHVVTFARPEMGKTAFNITIAAGFARQGALGIYFGNEDRIEDIYLRSVCNLTGFTESRIRDNPQAARELAFQRGLGNIKFISLAPGTPRQVDAFCEKFRPKWIVMDQLRNLNVKESNKVLQLEYATSSMRNTGKKYDCIVVSTTQAGDSAEGKAVLDMGDIDFSNTGVAAQADVLAGIGATADQYRSGLRTIHLSKNKVSGDHATFTTRLDQFTSCYTSIGES